SPPSAGFLLWEPLELLAKRLNVLPHLVGHPLGAFIGGAGARIVGVNGRLLGHADRLVVVLLGHGCPRRLPLVLRRPELDGRAARRHPPRAASRGRRRALASGRRGDRRRARTG